MAMATARWFGILSARGLAVISLLSACFSPSGKAGTGASTSGGTGTGTTAIASETETSSVTGTTTVASTSSATTSAPTTGSTNTGTVTSDATLMLTDTLTTGLTELTGETLTTLTTLSSSTGSEPVCGDSIIDPDEECDDGNSLPDDGCGPDCKFELLEQRYVFVTSQLFVGVEIGGIGGGDDLCNELAASSELLVGRSFIAWLSVDGKNARDRLSPGKEPYVRTDQQLVAADNDVLLGAMLDAPIDHDEHGSPVMVGTAVWTGTLADGTVASDTCGGWGMGGGNGVSGLCTANSSLWTNKDSESCILLRHLYCVEVPPP